jgi:hypothetical protein
MYIYLKHLFIIQQQTIILFSRSNSPFGLPLNCNKLSPLKKYKKKISYVLFIFVYIRPNFVYITALTSIFYSNVICHF